MGLNTSLQTQGRPTVPVSLLGSICEVQEKFCI